MWALFGCAADPLVVVDGMLSDGLGLRSGPAQTLTFDPALAFLSVLEYGQDLEAARMSKDL